MGYIYFILIIIALIALEAYFHSPAVKGRKGEQDIVFLLDINSLSMRGSKTLTNVYLPKESGDTTEIDVLYITRKGLFVIESKNYAGYIFGNEANKSWTVTLYAGKSWSGGKKVEKHQFYNPIRQNRTHIKYLKSYLGSDWGSDIKTFSLVTFSDRGSLKNVSVNTDAKDVYVCNHADLRRILRKISDENPDVLDDAQIEEIYNKLLPLTKVDKTAKKEHIEKINDRFGSTDVCPVCGGKLVLRTAKKGPNAGNQFYGCSNYPKCKYTKKL